MDEMKKATSEYRLNDKQANSLLDSLLSDKELMKTVHELGLNDEEVKYYIPLLASYQENKEEIKKDPNTLVMILEISDSGKLTSRYEESSKAKEERLLMSNYLMRDFPSDWLSASLKSFRTEREKELRAKITKSLKNKQWFYLYGPLGAGKSYAMAAVLNDLAAKGKKVAFINANKCFEYLKGLAINDKKQFEVSMQSLEKVEYLAIDDFGSEFKSDYVRDTIVLPLLLERSKNHLFTMFSSDYSLDEIKELYNFKYGANILSNKLVSMIKDNLLEKGGYRLEKGFENLLKR